MMFRRYAARSVCLVLLATASASATGQQPPCPTPEFMTRADIRGLGLADVTGDRIDVAVHGFAEYPTACVTEDTIFEAASLTKPVVAYVVMRLVDQDRLALDDVIIERLPSLPLPQDDPRSGQVTVRMALSHSTGLQGPDDGTLQFVNDPGETFRYYPAGYRLVQRVVEHLEGATLEEIARREVFGPLGMSSSSLVFREDLLDRVATRHRMLGDPIQRRRDPTRPANAAASLITTPRDYGRFLRATLTGQGLRPESHRAMLSPQVTVPDTDGAVAWGIGWGLEPAQGRFFHWGDDGAAKCFTMGSREDERAVVSLTNSYYGMSVAGEVAAERFPGEHPSVEWLNYAASDSPRRLARRDTVRAFVDGDADLGMATFERYERDHPELDMNAVARFVVWILDGRGKHEGRARLLAWQIERQPENLDLRLNRARSLREIGELPAAIETLRNARLHADEATAALIDGQVRWMEDDLLAEQHAGESMSVEMAGLTGAYGERRVLIENDRLVYRRGEGPRYVLRWLHGTTFALEGLDWFRVRLEMDDGRATTVIGLYSDGRSDESPRTGPSPRPDPDDADVDPSG